jgi:hypothetical protein
VATSRANSTPETSQANNVPGVIIPEAGVRPNGAAKPLQRLACSPEQCHDSCDQFFPAGPRREDCFRACLRKQRDC